MLFIFFCPPGEPREEAADRLNAILRVAGKTDDNILNGLFIWHGGAATCAGRITG